MPRGDYFGKREAGAGWCCGVASPPLHNEKGMLYEGLEVKEA